MSKPLDLPVFMIRLETLRRLLTHPSIVLAAPILGVALLLPSLGGGWQVDDILHRVMLLGPPPGFPMGRANIWNLFSFTGFDPGASFRLMDYGAMPWWTLPEGRIGFLRPLTILTHLLDYQLWPHSALLMHAHNLIWYAGVVAAAAVLYRRLIQAEHEAGMAWAAGIAAVLFAVDDAHALPAGWIANRNALLTAFFGFMALIAHDRWRREGWRPGAMLGPAALALGLLSGEAAVSACGYLFAYTLFLDRAPRLRRWAALVPYVVIGAIWTVAYKKMGYGAFGSEVYIDPGTEPWRFMSALAVRAPLLLLGQFGFPPSDISIVLVPAGIRLLVCFALIFLLLLGFALLPIMRRDATARFWLLGMLLSLVPISATFPNGRLMLYAGLGGFGLIGQFMASLGERADWLPSNKMWGRLAGIFAWIFIVVHGVISPLSLPIQSGTAAAIGMIVKAAAASVPDDPSIATKDLIVVNIPSPFLSAYILLEKVVDGKNHPARLRTLTGFNDDLEIRRTDDRTLVIRPSRGLFPLDWPEADSRAIYSIPFLDLAHGLNDFNLITRARNQPLRLGEKISLTGVTFEITSLTPDGRAAEFAVRFDRPLEDPSLMWMHWDRSGILVPFKLPEMGETMTLPVVPLLF